MAHTVAVGANPKPTHALSARVSTHFSKERPAESHQEHSTSDHFLYRKLCAPTATASAANAIRFSCLGALLAAIATSNARATDGFMIGERTMLGPGVNTVAREYGPSISTDGLALYFQRPDVGDIFVSRRASAGSPWSPAQRVDEPVNSSADDRNPDISNDGRTLYFSSSRPGGYGDNDIWVSHWDAESGSWGEATNLGQTVNQDSWDVNPHVDNFGTLYFQSNRGGSANIWSSQPLDQGWTEPELLISGGESPSVTADGRMLFYSAGGEVHVATRDGVGDPWSQGINLGRKVNSSESDWGPDVSPDGDSLYWSIGDIWQVPLIPLEPKPITPGSEAYFQDFDDALTSSASAGSQLPRGWTTTANGVIFDNVTTVDFPPSRSVRQGSVLNVGDEGGTDRAIAVGARNFRGNVDASMIQFLGLLEETDAVALQLEFDVEAWLGENKADSPGEAAFNVLVEVDSGDGFSPIEELTNVTTGMVLSPPEGGGVVNGNDAENRTSFSSGVQATALPARSALRIRWEVPESSSTNRWVFGLDNVKLNLFDNLVDAFDCSGNGALNVADADCSDAASLNGMLSAANLISGDADGDGQVQFSDFLILSNNFGLPGQYTDGDFDADGEVQFSDFLTLSQNFGVSSPKAAAVPEPVGTYLALCGVLSLGAYRRRR